MQGGDISNEVTARFLLVFEGLIGILPDKRAEAKFSRSVRFKRWEAAVGQFHLNEMASKVVWDTVWRRNYSVDVVTFLGDDMVDHVRNRIEHWGLPVGKVWTEDKYLLARTLNYRPDVIGVYHTNPADFAVFGSKGRVVDPAMPTLIGGY
ncbi:hypothetical protein [Terracoccus sp. 273MFTsu3.1]|uniref:hypothetical protein n=1 Tax=Terracoccus sp. 273MFTsu3.1 TaxID=1172188 RepID=UPI00036913BD|nr:hypothetical protein [Terracoccus sp. 273MFTsu3.1]